MGCKVLCDNEGMRTQKLIAFPRPQYISSQVCHCPFIGKSASLLIFICYQGCKELQYCILQIEGVSSIQGGKPETDNEGKIDSCVPGTPGPAGPPGPQVGTLLKHHS